MATYYVFSGAAGTNSGADWTNAFTSFNSLVAAMNLDGDIAKVHYAHQEEAGADATYTFTNSVAIFSVNKDSSDALTPMGQNGWLGSSTTSWSVIINGTANKRIFTKGLTIRMVGTGAKGIQWGGTSDGCEYVHEDAYSWSTNTSSSSTIRVGSGGSNTNSFVHLKNYDHQAGHVNQNLSVAGALLWEGGQVNAAGSAITTLFTLNQNVTYITVAGVDLSKLGTNYLVPGAGSQTATIKFVQCKVGSLNVLTTQTTTNRSGLEAWLHDCHSGDTHGIFGHYNALGSTVSYTSIYMTTSPSSGMSWKVTFSANATRYNPYYTPWIRTYNSTLASMSASLEILRDGSTTPYTDAEIGANFSAKVTTGSTQVTIYTVFAVPLASGTNILTGEGVAAWTGDTGAWSGKIDKTIVPAEVGDIRARVFGGSGTEMIVYVEPAIGLA